MIKFHNGDNYWDQTLLKEVLKFADGNEKIYIVAGEYADVNEVKTSLKEYDKLIITSDEQSKFLVEEIEGIETWVQYPKEGRHDKYRKLPLGQTPHAREKFREKTLDYFFAGQITHAKRYELEKQLAKPDSKYGLSGEFIGTKGFSQGLEPNKYIEKMNLTKVVPAPSGPITAETFRLYEALELGAVPIADSSYFKYLFGSMPPFPILKDYSDLLGYIEDQANQYPQTNNRVQAWWLQQKRNLKNNLLNLSEQITVIIPSSPIPSHPDVKILDETIKSIRVHLPKAEILITFDGVRREQENRRSDYEQFIARALRKCNNEWKATPYLFDKHSHQSGMAKFILDEVKTPLILYAEQDTPLAPDLPIEWELINKKILSGEADVVRLHFEAVIPEDHQHMIHGQEGKFIRTSQWSQRPHVSSVAFYKRILKENFSENANCFIEDQMHSICNEVYILYGMTGWNQYKLWIYAPEDNLKRSYHTDGRENANKYDERQRF